MNLWKRLYFPALIFLLVCSVSCSNVNYLHLGAFKAKDIVEDTTDTRNFVVKNDGTKIYGDKISWKSGLLLKNEISIDGQLFKMSEIRAYRGNNIFYHRMGSEYIRRIIRGKINVYIKYSMSNFDGQPYTRTDHYFQKGENEVLHTLSNKKEIQELVAGCSMASEMLDVSYGKLRKEIKKDKRYLNTVFEIYNNGCKIVK